MEQKSVLNSVEEAVEDFRQGKVVIVVDDEDRENEGDFIVAAELITPEAEMLTSLGLNSLELADLIVMCEERFGIVFEDEDLASLITIGDVVAYIEARA